MTSRTVTQLARHGPLVYRPHPSEIDALSRAGHLLWRLRGVEVTPPDDPRIDSSQSLVVSIFSTGILEAAAAGRRSFRFCVDPPAWLAELWNRYAMAPLGSSTPTVVETSSIEPAAMIADAVEEVP